MPWASYYVSVEGRELRLADPRIDQGAIRVHRQLGERLRLAVGRDQRARARVRQREQPHAERVAVLREQQEPVRAA